MSACRVQQVLDFQGFESVVFQPINRNRAMFRQRVMECHSPAVGSPQDGHTISLWFEDCALRNNLRPGEVLGSVSCSDNYGRRGCIANIYIEQAKSAVRRNAARKQFSGSKLRLFDRLRNEQCRKKRKETELQ